MVTVCTMISMTSKPYQTPREKLLGTRRKQLKLANVTTTTYMQVAAIFLHYNPHANKLQNVLATCRINLDES